MYLTPYRQIYNSKMVNDLMQILVPARWGQVLAVYPGSYGFYSTVLVSLAEVDDVRTEIVIFPQPANFGDLPVIIIMANRFAIIYNLTRGKSPLPV